MADPRADQDPSLPSPTTRRQRAPTITIDTSAVSPPLLEDGSVPLQNMPDPPFPPQYEPSEDVKPKPPSTLDDHSPTDLRAARSFESKESRPTSPHNVTSPASKWSDIQPHNFLSVPNARSRGSSVDSDEPGHSPTSYGGDTYVPSPASSGLEQHSRPSGTQPDHDHIINDADALKPDPGTEADFQVVDNRFAFSPGQLSKLLNPKSLSAFYALGGLSGIEKGLRTNRDTGLSADETGLDGSVSFEDALNAAASRVVGKDEADDKVIETSTIANEIHPPTDGYVDRKRIFKENRLPEKKTKSILELAWIAYNDKVLMLLTAAALVSLALGIYQSRSGDPEEKVQWVEGVAIAVAIIIVVLVGAANDWQKERQFVKLNKKKDERNVKVIRSGKSREISVHDILVGDVMHLEAGDMIPVDGIFISGHNLTCDESSATGESDLLRKTPGDDVYAALAKHQSTRKMDPFIISGGKVTEGIGTFIVTAVGIYSSYGRTMMSLREPPQTTPLQMKLNILAEYIAKLGLTAGLVLFTATFIKFLAGLNEIEGGAAEKGKQFVRVFIVAVTIVVVAVPEGLPLAVTLALAFATIRMLKDNNLVRLLKACETMGNATTICSDKTGTLTQNKMSTVAAVLGTSARFGDKNVSSSSETSSPQSPVESKIVSSEADRHDGSIGRFVSSLDEDVKSLLMQSIAVNSTAFEGAADGQEAFVGSKTETALLSFARDHLGMGPLNEERANANVVQMVPFDSGRKCMAAVVKLHDSRYRMLVKGASEILLGKCSKIIQDPTKGIAETDMSHEYMEILTDTITSFASRSLRTIGLVYRDFDQWPPKGAPAQVEDPTLAVFDKVFIDMVFLGIVGIQDPLRVGVAEAVRQCQMAGVYVRMVTGDNILTAKAIAQECGIHTPGGLVMEGPHFRKLDRREMNAVIPKLQVLARSSPEDKRILVKRLKELGETVAVTGDGTNDAPALKTADVGFSMGIAGTEVAKEASAIVLLDDNFASIVKAIMWGRAVNDAVQKFLQFQITVNITAVFLTFISAVYSDTETSVLTAVQLLWVNLIMDTLAALALATDPPTPKILNRKPQPKSAPLITLNMWKMIIGQSIFQLVVTLVLYFRGEDIFSYTEPWELDQLQTAIFNTFVFMQIFNQYNNRRLDNKFNIFEGIHRNYFFIGIQFIIFGGQVLIIFVGGQAFQVHRLQGHQWAFSIILGLCSLPAAVLIRLIPDDFIRRLIPAWFKRKRNPKLVVSDETQHYEWNPALEEIREELSVLKILRGGRLQALRYRLQHPRDTLLPRSRSGSRSRASSTSQGPTGEPGSHESTHGHPPATPESRQSISRRPRSNSAFGPAAVMAGVIAGSIGGWSPVERRDAEHPPDRSDLERPGGGAVPPGTEAHDYSTPPDAPGIRGSPHELAEKTPPLEKI